MIYQDFSDEESNARGRSFRQTCTSQLSRQCSRTKTYPNKLVRPIGLRTGRFPRRGLETRRKHPREFVTMCFAPGLGHCSRHQSSNDLYVSESGVGSGKLSLRDPHPGPIDTKF